MSSRCCRSPVSTARWNAAIYPPETYARLAAVKRHYDPGNLFTRNHNIKTI
jgi:hypothetical protein